MSINKSTKKRREMQSPRQLESIRCEAPLGGTGDSQRRHPVEHFISSPFFFHCTVHGTEEDEEEEEDKKGHDPSDGD